MRKGKKQQIKDKAEEQKKLDEFNKTVKENSSNPQKMLEEIEQETVERMSYRRTSHKLRGVLYNENMILTDLEILCCTKFLFDSERN